jgi:hypothetical protein
MFLLQWQSEAIDNAATKSHLSSKCSTDVHSTYMLKIKNSCLWLSTMPKGIEGGVQVRFQAFLASAADGEWPNTCFCHYNSGKEALVPFTTGLVYPGAIMNVAMRESQKLESLYCMSYYNSYLTPCYEPMILFYTASEARTYKLLTSRRTQWQLQ